MKADIEAREARKKVSAASALAANIAGNDAVKNKDYLAAIEHYTRAIDANKSEKSYYTNRALAYLHTFDYASAAKDCNTALDIFDCFESAHSRFRSDFKNMKLVLKAYLRRSKAQVGLAEYAQAREGLLKATQVAQEIYEPSSRQDPTFAKAKKEDFAEISKMITIIQEKEAFANEEKKITENKATAALTTAAEDADKALVPVAAPAAASSGSSSADDAALSTLLASITSAHHHLLSSSSSSSAAAGSSGSPNKPSWSLLTPAVQFLSLALEGDGNKDRVASHVDSRLCIDVLIKILKHRSAAPATAAKKSDAAAPVSSSATLPLSLPDFASVLPLFGASHAQKLSNGIWWRERDGFAALAKYLNQLFALLSSPASASGLPTDLLGFVVRVLMVLTDREQAREYLSSPSNAPVLTSLAVEMLRSSAAPASPGSSATVASTPKELESLQLNVCLLIANLAFQPKYRTWLCSSADNQTRMLDPLFQGVLAQSLRCALTNGKGATSSSGASSTEPHAAVLSAGLTALINLLTHAGCRTRLIECGGAASSSSSSAVIASSPLLLLLSSLTSLTACWSAASYRISVGSVLAELSDKILSIVLNLSVDDASNARIFSLLLEQQSKSKDGAAGASSLVLARLLALASKPSQDSKADEVASATSTVSTLPPLLVERALGVLTRGLRREHNATPAVAASAAASAPSRPIRAMVTQQSGFLAIMRILALHQFATAEESVSAESVLARLESKHEEGSAAATVASSSSVAASAAPSFRYTRLTMEHASVCLAICMSHDVATARSVALSSWQGSTGLQVLVSLLSSPHRNIVGNACLCIDGLTGIADILTRPELSAALPALLSILKDPAAKAAHQNAAKAAIVIGRAPNNAEAWTRMRGLEVIARVMAPTLLKK